jgi:hypothetical protein
MGRAVLTFIVALILLLLISAVAGLAVGSLELALYALIAVLIAAGASAWRRREVERTQ